MYQKCIQNSALSQNFLSVHKSVYLKLDFVENLFYIILFLYLILSFFCINYNNSNSCKYLNYFIILVEREKENKRVLYNKYNIKNIKYMYNDNIEHNYIQLENF